MNDNTVETLLESEIAALKAGDTVRAYNCLSQATTKAPKHIPAWL